MRVSKRILRLMRSAKTKAEEKYAAGGRIKGKAEHPKPVTLARGDYDGEDTARAVVGLGRTRSDP